MHVKACEQQSMRMQGAVVHAPPSFGTAGPCSCKQCQPTASRLAISSLPLMLPYTCLMVVLPCANKSGMLLI